MGQVVVSDALNTSDKVAADESGVSDGVVTDESGGVVTDESGVSVTIQYM